MNESFLSMRISEQDASVSSRSIELLRPYIMDDNHSLVFFVGAGASMAGNTGIPSTPSLLYHLLLQALSSSGKFDLEQDNISAIIKDITSYPCQIGFEVTLNDFWQICRQATALLYESFAYIESKCMPNRVHAFLAYWLSTGGTVITTNYDRLIEHELAKAGESIQSRYHENGSNSFAEWKEDLNHGGTLFKIHGSLDDANSCLGALEHVSTRLSGNREELLEEIIRTRPLCFVGWQGVDPDIPALLYGRLDKRNSSLPTFWIHYEGNPPNSTSLQKAIDNCPVLIKGYAENQPILTEADRAFGKLLNWVGIVSKANPVRASESFDFSKAISKCTKTGLTRMVGITFRRAGNFVAAEQVLKVALELAETPGERSASLQEISLLRQQITGRETDLARRFLKQAREALKESPDLRLQLNTDFGLLSMTIVNIKSRPWLLPSIPRLFRRYRQSIEALRNEGIDKESVALHESLLHLYKGRLRFKVLGWLGVIIRPLAKWILKPFDIARSTIEGAKDIHLHSHIDVLAYRAVALSHFRQCQAVREDVSEIERFIAILNDDARTKHWKNQIKEIEHYCGKH